MNREKNHRQQNDPDNHTGVISGFFLLIGHGCVPATQPLYESTSPPSPKMSKPAATAETALPSTGMISTPCTPILASVLSAIASPAPVADKLASLALPNVEIPAATIAA